MDDNDDFGAFANKPQPKKYSLTEEMVDMSSISNNPSNNPIVTGMVT
jgi:hypothetical protein